MGLRLGPYVRPIVLLSLGALFVFQLAIFILRSPSNPSSYISSSAPRTLQTSQSSRDAVIPLFPGDESQAQALFACQDMQRKGGCKSMLSTGHCYGDMLFTCMRTCGQCMWLKDQIQHAMQMRVHMVDDFECKDASDSCEAFVQPGRCTSNPGIGMAYCKASCGFCTLNPASSSNPASGGAGTSASSSTALGVQGRTRQLPGSPAGVPASSKRQDSACTDLVDICSYMAQHLHLCTVPDHIFWMGWVCRRSCGVCDEDPQSAGKVVPVESLRDVDFAARECVDFHIECHAWASRGKCIDNPLFMGKNCPRSCSQCPSRTPANATGAKIWQVGLDVHNAWQYISPATAYATRNLDNPPAQSQQCVDSNSMCTAWARMGECLNNASFMRLVCALACGMCDTGASATKVQEQFEYVPTPLAQVRLNNGVLMPTLGFGTAGLGVVTQIAVNTALQLGYRHFDSAQARDWYREDLTGAAVRQVLSRHTVTRAQLFLTTKVHPRHLGYNATMAACKQSLEDFGTSYMDLILLHYPLCWGELCGRVSDTALGGPHLVAASRAAEATSPSARTWRESWRALQALYNANITRAIGVSNFDVHQLQALLAMPGVRPQVVQVRMDPFSQAKDVRAFCRKHGIQVVAYSTLGTQYRANADGSPMGNPVMSHPHLETLSHWIEGDPTIAQVVLRWAQHMGAAVIPRSSNPVHMRDTLTINSFNLTAEQLQVIVNLDGSLDKRPQVAVVR